MLNIFHDLFHKEMNKTAFMEMIPIQVTKTYNVKRDLNKGSKNIICHHSYPVKSE